MPVKRFMSSAHFTALMISTASRKGTKMLDLAKANAQKIQQQIGEVLKKYKLDIQKPSVAELEEILGKLQSEA